jgi:hypothetical protein
MSPHQAIVAVPAQAMNMALTALPQKAPDLECCGSTVEWVDSIVVIDMAAPRGVQFEFIQSSYVSLTAIIN